MTRDDVDDVDDVNEAGSPPSAGTSFYDLGFAAQMIVWATRKRLHSLAGGADDSHVAESFELASLDDLYDALTSIADVLACGPSRQIQLHAVSCPCLAPHEIAMLNALAHLQADDEERAFDSLSAFMGRPAARLVWPAMLSIANDLADRDLCVEHCAAGVINLRGARRALH